MRFYIPCSFVLYGTPLWSLQNARIPLRAELLRLHRGNLRLLQLKKSCNTSVGKPFPFRATSLRVGSRGMPPSDRGQQTSYKRHKRLVGRKNPRREATSAWERSSSRPSSRQGLCMIAWGKAHKDGDWQEFKFGAWAFNCVGRELGRAIRTVNAL